MRGRGVVSAISAIHTVRVDGVAGAVVLRPKG